MDENIQSTFENLDNKQRRAIGESNHSANLLENIQATNETLELERESFGGRSIGEINLFMVRKHDRPNENLKIDQDLPEEPLKKSRERSQSEQQLLNSYISHG